MTNHINPGTDTTINPVVIDDSKRSTPNKGDLVYGSVTKSGEDWRMRSFDAGMGETEYRIFKDGIFFAQLGNRKDADTVMELMTGAHPPEAQQRNEYKFNSTELLLLAHDEWKRREERKHTHEEPAWVSGFLNGFCTDKKWAREYIDALLQEGRK